jgi:hypothetical protein
LQHQIPGHRRQALADHLLGNQINQNRTEERQRNADAAEDEILPGRLHGFRRAIDADHHHRRESGHLDPDPQQPDIVGDQRDVHRAHHGLIERVIEAQVEGRQPADVELMADIRGAENAGREADKGGEGDEVDVEIVDQHDIGSHAIDEQE